MVVVVDVDVVVVVDVVEVVLVEVVEVVVVVAVAVPTLATKASLEPLKVRSGPTVTGKVASVDAVGPVT